MALTMRHVLDELDQLERERDGDPPRPEIVRDGRARGADGRARQLRRDPEPDRPRRGREAGDAAGPADRPGADRGRARRNASEARLRVGARARRGHDADRDPGDGRGGRRAARRSGCASGSTRTRPRPSRTRCSPRCWRRRCSPGEEAVRHTPEQLDVLAEAGVVDAGALGLVVIIRGMVAGLAGEQVQLPEIPHYAAARLDQVHHADSAFRYCTNFIVTGEGLDGDSFVPAARGARRLGRSSSATQATLKVHVHTDDPEAARPCSPSAGEISHEDIADMHEQVAEPATRGSAGGAPAWSRSPAATGCGAVRGARRRGRRRRPDAQPADQGPARGDRACLGRRGGPAAELAATC